MPPLKNRATHSTSKKQRKDEKQILIGLRALWSSEEDIGEQTVKLETHTASVNTSHLPKEKRFTI
jgi:hypothetical protein